MSVIAMSLQARDAETLEAMLADRRREWFRQWPAKELARDLGCEVRTAVGYRNGNRPAPQQVETMVRVWGRSILDVLYGPLMEAPDLTITDRLARVLREATQIQQELEALHDRLHENPVRPGASHRTVATGHGADAGQDRRGAECAVDGADPVGDLDYRAGVERRQFARRVSDIARRLVCLAMLCVVLSGQVSGSFDDAGLDLRRGPSAARVQARISALRGPNAARTGGRARTGEGAA